MDTSSPQPRQEPIPAHGQLLLQRLKGFYEQFSADGLRELESIYTTDVEFRDPVHVLHGCLALRHYLRKMAVKLSHYRIRYLSELCDDNSAWLSWEMEYAHPSLNDGEIITLRGMSQLRFTDRVYYHEDCYDLGALVYEHVPVLGFATRRLKKMLAG